ncbi:MAG: dihydrofolate reductase [Bacteroidota bacterium]
MPAPEIVIIAALAERDRLIGDGLDLPWHIPADLKRFKRLTVGHPLVMGRRTFESLVHQFGGPLPKRANVVLTRDAAKAEALQAAHPEIVVFDSLDAALAHFADAEQVFIGGGAAVYAAALPIADRLELTLVEGTYTGDTFFPPYAHLIGSVFAAAATDHHDGFRFVTYLRRPTEPHGADIPGV